MRTITFRGKVKHDGRWVYGSLLVYGDGEHNIFEQRKHNYKLDSYNVEPETVGQSTGLKDSIGREIFEGDIVMTYVYFTNEEEEDREFWRVGEVRFIAGGFHLTNCTNYDISSMKEKSDIQPSPKSKFSFPAYRSQLMGNIHDNPELLKGGKHENQ
jgi:phage uncharacterized protein TIGR01671